MQNLLDLNYIPIYFLDQNYANYILDAKFGTKLCKYFISKMIIYYFYFTKFYGLLLLLLLLLLLFFFTERVRKSIK